MRKTFRVAERFKTMPTGKSNPQCTPDRNRGLRHQINLDEGDASADAIGRGTDHGVDARLQCDDERGVGAAFLESEGEDSRGGRGRIRIVTPVVLGQKQGIGALTIGQRWSSSFGSASAPSK